jgi:LysR family transcriptional regulator, hypochlorite-specific transcription factor HypT
MELKWLEDFVALARNGSFSRAAEERYVTQPAFSRRIRSLEHWLGVELFDRSSAPVRLTEFGRNFMPHAVEIIASATTVRQDFRLLTRAQNSEVKVATLHMLSVHLLPSLAARFLAAHANARIEVIPNLQGTAAYFEAIESGSAHLVIAYAQQRPGQAQFDELEERLIARDEMIPVASRELVRRIGRPDFSRADARFPVAAYSELTFSHQLVAPVVDALEARCVTVASAPLSEAIAAMVAEHIGVGWVPRSMVRAPLASGAMVQVGASEHTVPIEIYAWRARTLTHRLALAFWDQLTSVG